MALKKLFQYYPFLYSTRKNEPNKKASEMICLNDQQKYTLCLIPSSVNMKPYTDAVISDQPIPEDCGIDTLDGLFEAHSLDKRTEWDKIIGLN